MNCVVVVSNRVPTPSAPGEQAGGLAVALDGLMQRRGGLWFGWSGKISLQAIGKPATIVDRGLISFATIDLTPEEHTRYYSNYSNGLLWPLLHMMPELMAFDRRDAQVYRAVNARFAETLAPLLTPNDLIWVHDYHLLALPAQLRARNVRNPIGFFLHIPFPAADVLAAAPDAASLLRQLLAADLIGFQTDRDLENFAGAAQVFAGALGFEEGWLRFPGRRVRLAVFPVEIEPREFAATAAASGRTTLVERLRASLHHQKLVIGVDRLDPTKGLLQRLAGFRRLLERHEEWRRHTTLLQIAAISRKEVAPYRELRLALDREAGSINSEFGDPDWTPLRIVARGGARNVMAGYMREARVGLVTPLRDGMNLVAKEYVAAQDPADPGVLILSQFAGAARQLETALLINPHDPDDMAEALDAALRMPLAERQERWQEMWRAIVNTSPLLWGRSFLAALLRAAVVAHVPVLQKKLGIGRGGDSISILSSSNPSGPILPGPRQVN